MTTREPPKSCFHVVPADVESPEFCLGLQTLLSLKVRRVLVLWGLTEGWERQEAQVCKPGSGSDEKDVICDRRSVHK